MGHGRGSAESIRREADELDFCAKELERRRTRDPRVNSEIMNMRADAAALYESAEQWGNAGFSYSKAARQAFYLHDDMDNCSYRMNAVRCFDRAGMQREGTHDLVFLGEMLIRLGEKAPEERGRKLLGMGVRAIEEARERFKRYSMEPGTNIRIAFEKGEIAMGKASEIPTAEEFWKFLESGEVLG